MRYAKVLYILTVYLLNETEGDSSKPKIYHKDMSEYCRRRVMPSVFIGNQIVEAHSKIMHFTQLEVPYSCSVSIRTELGSNIILVLQIIHDTDFCVNDASPVKVFEMGETFGGYWGAIPNSIVQHTPRYIERYYTLRNTPVAPMVLEGYFDSLAHVMFDSEETTTAKTPSHLNQENENYYTVEIPLMNVSARLVPGTVSYNNSFSVDDTFDVIYDVAQKPGVSYDTTVIPLAQFNIREENSNDENVARKDGALRTDGVVSKNGSSGQDGAPIIGVERHEGSSTEPRYMLDYKIEEYTVDPRLTLSYNSQKIRHKNRNYLRRHKKRKNKANFFALGKTNKPYRKPISKIVTSNETTYSWSRIEDLLKNLTQNESEEFKKQKAIESEKFSALVQKLDDWQHNYSAYLAPNLFDGKHPSYLDKTLLGSFQTTAQRSVFNPKDPGKNEMNTEQSIKLSSISNVITSTSQHSKLEDDDISFVSQDNVIIDKNKEFIYTESTSTTAMLGTSETLTKTTTGIKKLVPDVTTSAIKKITNSVTRATESLYSLKAQTTHISQGAESNLKQETPTVTPIIDTSLYLNTVPNLLTTSSVISAMPATNARTNHATTEHTAVTQAFNVQESHMNRPGIRRKRKIRKKRDIQQIMIEDAKPHRRTTRPDVITTPEPMFHFTDIQDFARLIELRDDEIRGHIPLLYLRRYVGAKLFDLCGNATSLKHVYLFNTSRIVLTITNFTLRRMNVIVTPARTLTRPDMFCSDVTLECQVSGARVCVDKITACDGIPHCGSYDIYDEDRLLCGKARDFKHDVYLAAFTLLLVMLTMAYTVHYWLKRCVPKVSEAFFIYTDGFENKLHLHSIMKSPIDTVDDNNLATIPQKNYLFSDLDITARTYKSKISALKNLFTFYRRKKKNDELEMYNLNFADGHTRFSFPEIEIGNLGRIQTYTVDEGVQTGESLDMDNASEIVGVVTYQDSSSITKIGQESIEPRQGLPDLHFNMTEEEAARRSSGVSELMVLQFLRDARALSVQRNAEDLVRRRSDLPAPERRLGSTVYDRSLFPFSTISPDLSVASYNQPYREASSTRMTSSTAFINEEPGTSATPAKRLRFEDKLGLPSVDGNEDANTRGSCVFEPDQESTGAGGAARDFMRFWGSKGKKPKKK